MFNDNGNDDDNCYLGDFILTQTGQTFAEYSYIANSLVCAVRMAHTSEGVATRLSALVRVVCVRINNSAMSAFTANSF